jgi:hypothetical protein
MTNREEDEPFVTDIVRKMLAGAADSFLASIGETQGPKAYLSLAWSFAPHASNSDGMLLRLRSGLRALAISYGVSDLKYYRVVGGKEVQALEEEYPGESMKVARLVIVSVSRRFLENADLIEEHNPGGVPYAHWAGQTITMICTGRADKGELQADPYWVPPVEALPESQRAHREWYTLMAADLRQDDVKYGMDKMLEGKVT